MGNGARAVDSPSTVSTLRATRHGRPVAIVLSSPPTSTLYDLRFPLRGDRVRGFIEEKGMIPEVKTTSSVGRELRARIPHRISPRRHFRWASSSFSISLSSPKRGLTDSPLGRRRRKIGERTGAEIGFPEGITPNSSNILLHRHLPRSPGIRSADERPGQVQGGENS